MGKRNKNETQPVQSKRKKNRTVSKIKAKNQMSDSASVENLIQDTNCQLKKSSKIYENDKTQENKPSLNLEKKHNDTTSEQVTTASFSNLGQTIKSKQVLNAEEAQVNDEDIDKFCDEIDDEDNEQFEIWVKQIELKLHSKNKK